MSQPEDRNTPPRPPGKAKHRELPVETTTAELFKGQTEVLIHHGDDTYRLRVTKSGKLVLNK